LASVAIKEAPFLTFVFSRPPMKDGLAAMLTCPAQHPADAQLARSSAGAAGTAPARLAVQCGAAAGRGGWSPGKGPPGGPAAFSQPATEPAR